MSAKSSRRARLLADVEAQRLGLLPNAEKQVFSGLRGILRRLFKSSQWQTSLRRWHKATLKTFAKQTALYMRSGQAKRDALERQQLAHLQRNRAGARRRLRINAEEAHRKNLLGER